MKLILVILAAALVLGMWLRVIRDWRLGLALFLLYTPISGAVQLSLFPAPWAVLIKDLAFALPAYIGFANSGEFTESIDRLPPSLLTMLAVLMGLVLAQALNPWGPGLLPTLIGLKVWLFYLPMLLLGWCYVRDARSLLRLSRLLTGLVWLPCLVGIAQYFLALNYGSRYAISRFYGEAAALAATQGFTRFNDVGLIRIPATFAFPAQYLNYILCMFVPVLGAAKIEPSWRWLRLRAVSVWLLCAAGFTTGTRAAFVVIPAMMLLFFLLRSRLAGVVPAAALIGSVFLAIVLAVGIDVPKLVHMETELTDTYSKDIAAGMLLDALNKTWIGLGVGSNTGAARFGVANAETFTLFENYYAKTVDELGIVGLIVVVLLHGGMILYAFRARRRLVGTPLQAYCDAAVAFFVIIFLYDFKGFLLDFDPLNALYWLYVGVMLALPALEARARVEEYYASVNTSHEEPALAYG